MAAYDNGVYYLDVDLWARATLPSTPQAYIDNLIRSTERFSWDIETAPQWQGGGSPPHSWHEGGQMAYNAKTALQLQAEGAFISGSVWYDKNSNIILSPAPVTPAEKVAEKIAANSVAAAELKELSELLAAHKSAIRLGELRAKYGV